MKLTRFILISYLTLVAFDCAAMNRGRFRDAFNFDSAAAERFARGMREMGDNVAEAAQRRQEEAARIARERENARVRRQEQLAADLAEAQTAEDRADIRRIYEANEARFTENERREAQGRDRWEGVGANFVNIIPQAYTTLFSALRDEQTAEHKLRETAVKADSDRKAAIAKHKDTLAAITNPQNLKRGVLALSALALGISAAWQGSKLVTDMIRHWYRNPTLAQETSLLSVTTKAKRYILGVAPEPAKVSDVVLEPVLADRIDKLATSVKNTVANKAHFRNILFYGPPGTGKTMLAQRIARSSGLDYIYFAASSLDQFSIEEAMIKLTELFEYAKKSSKKLMIIIDEAEVLFANRDKELSEKARKMLTHVLTYTGTESKDFLLTLLTNRPQDLDKAVLNRCDEQIEISAPSAEQRRQILSMYINKYLINAQKEEPKPSFISNLFGTETSVTKLKIADGVFSEGAIDTISARLVNFVGRDISKLVLAIQATAYATADKTITKDMVDTIVAIRVAAKQQEIAGFVTYSKKSAK